MDAINWQGFFKDIEPVEVITDKRRVHLKSRDYFWYSPILFEQLKACSAEALVIIKSREDVIKVAAACAKWKIPVTLRGGGTGNYGQAVPLVGGIVMDMTGLEQVCEIGDGVVRVDAGMMIAKLQENVEATNQELLMWPSTKSQATIGGFISGGSAGIGSIRHGVLRDEGNIKSVSILTLEENPKIIRLEGRDIQKVHHAYGTNGIILEMELALVPKTEWVHVIGLFDQYRHTLDFSLAVCDLGLEVYLLCTLDKRFAPHYRSLEGYFPDDKHAVFAMVAPGSLDEFKSEITRTGGTVTLSETENTLAEQDLPPVYEGAYNHTTLQVLKTDRSWTYLQIAYPQPFDPSIETALLRQLEPELYYHHEFAKERGDIQVFAIHLIKWSTKQRLYEVAAKFEEIGCTVFDGHDYTIAGGGMKVIDQLQVDFKKIADPHALMNPGKTSHEEAAQAFTRFNAGC